MKIQKVRFQNFKNVPNIEKELNGSNILLIADNTFGKSNFMRGIKAALAGTVGKNAIKEGEKKAEVEVGMADFNEEGQPIEGTDYTFKLKVRKNKEGDEVVALEVTAPNGMVETKKTMIGSIAGEVELDYDFVELSKSEKGKKKQVEIIRSYLSAEDKEALGVWESKAKKAYDDRTEIGRTVKTLEGYVAELGITSKDVEQYKDKKDKEIKELNDAIEKASETNTKIEGVADKVKLLQDRKGKIPGDVKKAEDKIAAIKKELEEAELNLKSLESEALETEDKITKGEEWLLKNKVVVIKDLQQQLNDANAHNINYEKVQMYHKKIKELNETKDSYADLTVVYETSMEAIQNTIREMEFPIEGVSFDENNVYYEGKMIDEACMSYAEIKIFEARLMSAKKSNTAVLFVDNGESIGLKKLIELQKEAEKHNMMIVMEQMTRGVEELRIEFMPEYK